MPPFLATGVINSLLFGIQGYIVQSIIRHRTPQVCLAQLQRPVPFCACPSRLRHEKKTVTTQAVRTERRHGARH